MNVYISGFYDIVLVAPVQVICGNRHNASACAGRVGYTGYVSISMLGMEITAVIVIQSWKIPCFQACAWLPQTSQTIFDAWDKVDAEKQTTSLKNRKPWTK